jgi:hypothetical protein
MLGKHIRQRDLFDVGNVFPLSLPASSFYAQLAVAAPRLFKDEDFIALYSRTEGRPSVAPSQLALVTILQYHDNVSDEEAINKTAYDLRWAAVLGRSAGEALCAKSTLQLFRAHLILHKEIRKVFQASIREAKRSGLLKGKSLQIALDTKPILGRGAVLDTCNLLAAGIRQLVAALAKGTKESPNDWMKSHDLSRYTESSIKATADIDWSDEAARNGFISGIVGDTVRLLSIVPKDSLSQDQVRNAYDQLQKFVLQDIETVAAPGADGAEPKTEYQIKKGTHPDRVPSATDPDVRHGRKSKSKRFVGSKASVAADTESQIILAVDVIPANAGDATGALDMVKQAEENTGIAVDASLTDCAYGGGETRQLFADAERTLIAKVPQEHTNGGLYPKSSFDVNLEAGTVTCPAGQMASRVSTLADGRRDFSFDTACASCALRSLCTTSKSGRTVSVHPQEALLREARAYQSTAEGRARMRERVVIEHRLARLGQLGIGQARYMGKAKTLFQLLMAATVANLRRVWNWELTPPAPDEADSRPISLVEDALSAVCGLVDVISLTILSRIMHAARRRAPILLFATACQS